MNNEIFQKVFDLIQPYLPEGWEKLILYVAYTTGSYSMKFYTADYDGIYTDCFCQKNVNRAQLIKLFMEIDKILTMKRNSLDEKNKWSVMTMTVHSSGKIKAEFDYTDISKKAIEYEQNWREKYLK